MYKEDSVSLMPTTFASRSERHAAACGMIIFIFLNAKKSVMNRNVYTTASRGVCELRHVIFSIALRTQCRSQERASALLNMQNGRREVYSSDIACFHVAIGALERSIRYPSQERARQKAIIVAIDDRGARDTTCISFLPSKLQQ